MGGVGVGVAVEADIAHRVGMKDDHGQRLGLQPAGEAECESVQAI